jgi:hypothetical protein
MRLCSKYLIILPILNKMHVLLYLSDAVSDAIPLSLMLSPNTIIDMIDMMHSLLSFAIKTAHLTMQIFMYKDLKHMSRIYLDLRLCR